MSSRGFAGAPVSKILCMLTAFATLVVLSNKSQDTVSLVGYRVTGERREWWRLLTSLFPLGSVWELMLSLHAIRVFRVLERHMGSSKFGSFILVSAVLTKTTELALCLQNPSLRPPSGPHAILTTLAITYYGYIPYSAPAYFTIGNFRVTEKFFVFSAVLMLAFSHAWSSTVSAGCGVIMALIYWSSLSPLQRFRVPGQRFFARCAALFPAGDQIAARRMQMERLQLQQRNARVGGGRQRLADEMYGRLPGGGGRVGPAMGLRQRIDVPPPSEQDIAVLMGLGFDRDTVIRVLRSSGNNPETAANMLLGI